MRAVLRDRLVGLAVMLLAAAAFLPMLGDGDGVRPEVDLDPVQRVERVTLEPLDGDAPEWSFENDAKRLQAEFAARKVRVGQLRLEALDPATEAGTELGPYAVQIGAFRSPARAVAERDRLAADGFHAFLSELHDEDGSITRVVVGPNISRQEAEAVARELRERYAREAFIVQLQP